MAYNTLDTVNATQGIHTILVYINAETNGIFIAMVLFGLFIVVALGSYFSQLRLRNKADFSVSFAVAGYFTFGASVILSLIPNLMNIFHLIVTLAISIIGTMWLILAGRSTD